jgi:hypothetical protein
MTARIQRRSPQADLCAASTTATLLSLCFALPAAAHHSSAMFDDHRVVKITGTVRAIQWTNPHCWIQLLVPGAEHYVEWSVEMGSPGELFRNGWRPRTLQPGDKISVTLYPLRDGSPAGQFVSAVMPDGRTLGKGQ